MYGRMIKAGEKGRGIPFLFQAVKGRGRLFKPTLTGFLPAE